MSINRTIEQGRGSVSNLFFLENLVWSIRIIGLTTNTNNAKVPQKPSMKNYDLMAEKGGTKDYMK